MPIEYYYAEAKERYAAICEYKKQYRELLAIHEADTTYGLKALYNRFYDTMHYIARQTGNLQAFYEYKNAIC